MAIHAIGNQATVDRFVIVHHAIDTNESREKQNARDQGRSRDKPDRLGEAYRAVWRAGLLSIF